MSKEPKPTFDPANIRDISEAVYRHELGEDDVCRMIEKDKDDGQKLRNRAASYDPLTRSYLKVLGTEQVFAFLNSIEGAGYGGMAEFEIARDAMRRASPVPSRDRGGQS